MLRRSKGQSSSWNDPPATRLAVEGTLWIGGITVALLLSACAGDDPTWVRTADTLDNGATRVRYSVPADPQPTWHLGEQLRIGTMDAAGPAMFGFVADLAVHRDGRIVVLDGQAQEVRVFSADGEHLRTFGGKGGGPGEFQAASGVAFGPDGLLRVPDQRNARMSFLDIDDGYIRAHPYQPLMFGPVWAGVVDSAGNSWSPHYLMGEREGEGSMAFVGYDTAGTPVDTLNQPRPVPHPLDEHPGRWAVFSDGELQANVPVPFYAWQQHVLSPSLKVWSTADGDPTYRLTRWEPGAGDTLLVIEVGRPLQPVDRTAADSMVQEYEERFGASFDRARIPASAPTVRGFFVDDDGRLWVRVRTGDDEVRTFDAFDTADGSYLGTLETGLDLETSPAPVVRGDTVWGVVRDELEVPFVIRARLVPVDRPGGN